MEVVKLKTTQGHTAEVTTHGSHVTSWKTPEGKELLFVSKKAIFAPPKAIRGGIPVCFPQFGMMGPMPTQHGFARNVAFEVESKEDWQVVMVLRYDGSSQPSYPHPFLLRITTSLCDNVLTQELQAHNTGSSDMSFTTALHTYFRVQDITKVRVAGLSGMAYLDNLAAQQQTTDNSPEVVVSGEVDRVYLAAGSDIHVHDDAAGTVIGIQRESLPDAVVWNPWVDKAAAMADFGDEEYKEMICIEPALAGSGPVTLAPGSCWTGKQIIRFTPAGAAAQ